MSRFGFLPRKASPAETPSEPISASENPIEPDEKSFSALGAQFGGENESLRNMLLDAINKINELDTIKAAVRKLVDPVSKALRDFEAEKAEKVGLQTVLSNTRTAYDKLRNEVGNLEKKLVVSERDCKALRQDLATAQTQLRTLEAARAEITIDVTARRAQVADLEARLAQQTGEANALREENRRLDERLVAANKRVIALESDLNAARQRLTLADDEKRAQQTLLGNASAESARLTRKLAETEASFNAVQGRLRQVEANFTDATSERARLATALEETNERHVREQSIQSTRFDVLQARATALEKVVAEARELLLSRAEQIRAHDRRNGELITERNELQARLSDVQAELLTRESELKEVEQARAIYLERNAALTRAFTGKEAALAQAEEVSASFNERVAAIETAHAAETRAAEQKIEELDAALRREKLERAVVQGALEAARKNLSRAMRSVMALQRDQAAQPEPARPRAANVA
jgi:crescentin